MGFIGGALGVRIMTWLCPDGQNSALDGSAYKNKSKLEILFGPNFFNEIRGRVVIDFGCGYGEETVEMAQRGAAKVLGLDVRESVLQHAAGVAARAGVAERCLFMVNPTEQADVIVSLDCFEHYDDPAAVLETMNRYLKPGGKILVSFGAPWYHPYGGHLFSVFPWAHLVFTERAMLEWRKRTYDPQQQAVSVRDVGLNKMTLRRFERYIADSRFTFAEYRIKPIRPARYLWTPLTREFFTSVLQCTLVRKTEPAVSAAA